MNPIISAPGSVMHYNCVYMSLLFNFPVNDEGLSVRTHGWRNRYICMYYTHTNFPILLMWASLQYSMHRNVSIPVY